MAALPVNPCLRREVPAHVTFTPQGSFLPSESVAAEFYSLAQEFFFSLFALSHPNFPGDLFCISRILLAEPLLQEGRAVPQGAGVFFRWSPRSDLKAVLHLHREARHKQNPDFGQRMALWLFPRGAKQFEKAISKWQ